MGRLVRYSKDQGDNMSSGQNPNQPYKLKRILPKFQGAYSDQPTGGTNPP